MIRPGTVPGSGSMTTERTLRAHSFVVDWVPGTISYEIGSVICILLTGWNSSRTKSGITERSLTGSRSSNCVAAVQWLSLSCLYTSTCHLENSEVDNTSTERKCKVVWRRANRPTTTRLLCLEIEVWQLNFSLVFYMEKIDAIRSVTNKIKIWKIKS